MTIYILNNWDLSDFIKFEADNDDEARKIIEREMAKRGWLEKDCTCWGDCD